MYVRMSAMYTVLSCLFAASTLAWSASVNEHQPTTTSDRNTCDSISEDDNKVKSLVQMSQRHKAVHDAVEQELDLAQLAHSIEAGMPTVLDWSKKDDGQSKDAELVEEHKEDTQDKNKSRKHKGDDGDEEEEQEESTEELPEHTLTFVTIYDSLFENNLGTSYLWLNRTALPHQWIVVNNTDNEPISKVYSKAQDESENELMVFVHPDVILPDEFYTDFMSALQAIESNTTDWGVLATAGNAPGPWLAIISSVTDFDGSSPYFGGDTMYQQVQSVDESLMVVRRNAPRFDAEMPGFDLYGMDIVLSAKKEGKDAFYMKVPIKHKTKDVDGNTYDRMEFLKKVRSQEYMDRVNTTVQYMQTKWCDSGLLPVQAPAFFVDCDTWRMT